MRKALLILSWLLALLFLAHDLYYWGGIAVTPKVGERIDAQATLESPLAKTYLSIGRQIVGGLGRAAQARDYAATLSGDLYPEIEDDQHRALARLLDAQTPFGRVCYYGGPLLLLLSLVLHARCEKPIRTFGR